MELVRTDVERKPVLAGGTTYSHLVSTKPHRLKRPVVLFHGAGGAAWYWEEWVNYFTGAGGYPTTAPDYPGHGGLAHMNIRTMSILGYVEHVSSYIRKVIMPAHGNLTPIVVGHSMGGLITQKLCELGLVHKAVLIAPAPPKGVRLRLGKDFIVPFRDYPAIIRSFATQGTFRPSERFLTSLFIDPEKSKGMIKRCADMKLYESPRAIWELLNSSIDVDSSKVTVPMFLIGFEKDHIITADVVRNIAQKYPHAELQIRNDLGHLCPLEYGWKKVAKKCLDWIA
jgi:pimeloyl-ACP methyl ester carboxylesterase